MVPLPLWTVASAGAALSPTAATATNAAVQVRLIISVLSGRTSLLSGKNYRPALPDGSPRDAQGCTLQVHACSSPGQRPGPANVLNESFRAPEVLNDSFKTSVPRRS